MMEPEPFDALILAKMLERQLTFGGHFVPPSSLERIEVVEVGGEQLGAERQRHV